MGQTDTLNNVLTSDILIDAMCYSSNTLFTAVFTCSSDLPGINQAS